MAEATGREPQLEATKIQKGHRAVDSCFLIVSVAASREASVVGICNSIGVGSNVGAGAVFSFVLIFFFIDSPRCFGGQERVFLFPQFVVVSVWASG